MVRRDPALVPGTVGALLARVSVFGLRRTPGLRNAVTITDHGGGLRLPDPARRNPVAERRTRDAGRRAPVAERPSPSAGHAPPVLCARAARAHHPAVSCPFCRPSRPLLAENPLAIAFADLYPVSPGHTLVIPRRHVASYFECTPEEKAALWELVDQVHALLLERAPGGFNVGINTGAVAGQTVFHGHVHVIPRYAGDAADPRGGVRGVVPGKAKYPAPRPAGR